MVSSAAGTGQRLLAAIGTVPRVALATLPTPLERAERLAAALQSPPLFFKRDDLTGLAFGGNKVRELEYILGTAIAEGADVLVAGGGVAQSNHARQCAAAARRVGMDPVLVLRRDSRPTTLTGNLLVTSLFDAEVHWVDADPGVDDREALGTDMDHIAARLKAGGRTPYVLKSSFHPLGALGYVGAGLELAAQLREAGIERAHIFCTSMGATQVGLRLAAEVLGLAWQITGVSWRPTTPGLAGRLAELAQRTAKLLGLDLEPRPDWFTTLDHGGPAYGIPSPQGWEMLQLAARTEGLLLDPVYTSKGFAGLVAELRGGRLEPGIPVVFLHTGGLPALFAYRDEAAAAGLFSSIDPRHLE